MKNTVNSNSKIGLDYFLYSCLEFENTSKAIPQKQEFERRWPVTFNLSDEAKRNFILQNEFRTLVQQMITWYKEKFPELTSQAELDYELLHKIIPPAIMMARDLNAVSELKNGSEFPEYFIDPCKESAPEWQMIKEELSSQITNYHEYLLRYLQWSFGAETPLELDVKIGSRPPVGRFAPRSFFNSRGSRGGIGFSSGDRKQGSAKFNHNRDRNENKFEANKSGNKHSQKQKSKDMHKKIGDDPDQQKNHKKEQESQREVIEAIKKFNSDPNLMEYKLQPANSYYRRLQHKQIKREGLNSESVGEGAERSVVILRKK
ncbi:MAG: hypothetical protein HQK54_00425 [Oligoflexales bacterium]|nr:hypothetical protein [Oligoflexales bacterium]